MNAQLSLRWERGEAMGPTAQLKSGHSAVLNLLEFLRRQNFEAQAAIFAGYFLAGHACVELGRITGSVVSFSPSTGIALAAFLIRGSVAWYLIFPAAFLVDMFATGSVAGSAVIALGQTLGPLFAAAIMGDSSELTKLFFTPASVLRFSLVAVPVGAAITASIGAATICLIGYAPNAEFIPAWFSWWQADAVGAIVLSPVILLLIAHHRHALENPESPLLLTMLGLVFVCILIFCPTKLLNGSAYPIQFLTSPLLAILVLRYCPLETVLANAIISGFAFWASIHNSGPFSYSRVPVSVSGAFVTVVCVTNLVLSAAFASAREKNERELILSQMLLVSQRAEIANLYAQLNELSRAPDCDAKVQ